MGFFKYKPMPKPITSVTVKTYAGKGPLSAAQRQRQEEEEKKVAKKALPMTAKAIEAEQARPPKKQPEEVPRLTRGPLQPPPTEKPLLAVDKPPEGTRTPQFAGGYTTTPGGKRVPIIPGASQLVMVTGAKDIRTYWLPTPSGHFIQTDFSGNPIVPGDTRYHTDAQLHAIREELGILAEKKGRIQFQEAQKIGLVPADATYVEGKDSWGYVSKGMLKEQFAAGRERKAWLNELRKDNPAAYKLIKEKGYDAFKKVYDKAIGVLEKKFKSDGGYDIQAALKYPRSITNEQLEMVFGKEAMTQQLKIQTAQVTAHTGVITRLGEGLPVSDVEYAWLVKPPDMSDIEYASLIPFVKPDSIDIIAAVAAGVPDKTIMKATGIEKKMMEDARWYAEYENAPLPKKMVMQAQKDPKEFAKTIAIGAIPGYGTAKYWESAAPWQKGLYIAGDVLFFIGVGAAVSAGVKGGSSLSRATLTTGRAVMMSPIRTLRHPIATIKGFARPIEIMMRKKDIPLAVAWRGEYAPMSVAKVGAGGTPLATRKAMEMISEAATAGKSSLKVRVAGTGEIIHYSGTGLQDILGDATVHASAGFPQVGKGIKVGPEGMFTAPWGYYKLTFSSATGMKPVYVMRGTTIVGDVMDAGKVFSKTGVIGSVKQGSKIIGPAGEVIAKVGEGGRLFKGNVEVGHLLQGGVAVDKANKVLGWLQDGASIVNEAGQSIGKTKSLPAFAVIRTAGVQQLPKWVLEAGSIEEMERRAMQMMAKGKMPEGLLPVFKQYKQWIELENLYPPGTKLLPVLDAKGNPVVLFTRGIGGERIPVLLLQEVNKNWLMRSIEFTRAMQGKPVVAVKSVDFGVVDNIPKKAGPAVKNWFKRNPDATVYGGFSEYVQTGTRIPRDLDAAVVNPMKAARELADAIADSAKVKTRVVATPKGGAAVEVFARGYWERAIDLHPASILKGKLPSGLVQEAPAVIDGVKMESLSTQMARLIQRSAEQWGEAPVRLQRIARSLGMDVELGIGARAPTLTQLYKLKAQGAYNTIRDIFKQGLTKEVRLKATGGIAPDFMPEVERLISLEMQMSRISRYARGLEGARRTSVLQGLEELRVVYNASVRDLRSRLNTRAKVYTRLFSELPSRYSPRAELRYKEFAGIAGVRLAREMREQARTRVTASSRARLSRRGEERMPRISRISAPERLPREQLFRMPRTPPPPPETSIPPPEKGISVIRRGTGLVKDVKGLPRRPGIVSWKQGLYWISVLPPYRKGAKVDILYSRKPPPLAKIRKGKPGETIYTWKGAPPEVLTIEMGAFEPTVTKGKSIAFARTSRAKAALESPAPKRIAGIRKARYKRNQPPPPEELLFR